MSHFEMRDDMAFPQMKKMGDVKQETGGLTKREYFAGLAMMNLQNVLHRKSGESALESYRALLGKQDTETVIAKLAVDQADALIVELEKTK